MKIFLSYSWSNKDIADDLDFSFQRVGINLMRDVRDAKYRTSIKEFMHQISRTDYVIMLISDQFLRSANCMYEVIELLNSHEFEKRILPILIENANGIYKAERRKDYYDFWSMELQNKQNLLTSYINEDFLDQKRKAENINYHLGDFFKRLTDLNTKTYEQIKGENFRPIFEITGLKKNHLITKLFSISVIQDQEMQELELDRFIEQNPTFANVWFYKGILASNKKEFDRAESYYEMAIDLDPGYAEAYNNLAEILIEHSENFLKAKDLLEQSLMIKPEFQKAKDNLEKLTESHFIKMYSAIEKLKEEIRINPGNSSFYEAIAYILQHHLRDYDSAADYYKKAFEVDPKQKQSLFNLALLYQQDIKDLDTARKYYEEYLKISPEDANALNNFGGLLMKIEIQDYFSAKKMFNRAIQADPKNGSPHMNLAILLGEHLKEYELASYHLNECLKCDFIKPEVYYLLMKFTIGVGLNKNQKYLDGESYVDVEDSLQIELTTNRAIAKGYYDKACELDTALITKALDKFFDIRR